MSGTSIDGIDGVLAEFSEEAAGAVSARTVAFESLPFPQELRDRLVSLQQPAFNDLEVGMQAGLDVARLYAQVVEQLLIGQSPDKVVAVGAHGQTVRHRPQLGYTIQLISGAHLAELCGIDVICDFRSADLAAGGQGAPLVPAFHRGVFAHGHKRRAIVNIGGIANVSLLAPGEPVRGFDTGPGNTLLDAWIGRNLSRSFDFDGDWAKTGKPDTALLKQLMADEYFARPAPKSTHRDHFTLEWLDAALAATASATPGSGSTSVARGSRRSHDVQATLAELSACSIAAAVNEFDAEEVYVCGGGAKNSDLLRRIAEKIAPIVIASTSQLGIGPQSVEALAFAWLARQRVLLAPGNETGATGANGPRVLGAWYRSGTGPA